MPNKPNIAPATLSLSLRHADSHPHPHDPGLQEQEVVISAVYKETLPLFSIYVARSREGGEGMHVVAMLSSVLKKWGIEPP